MTHEQIVTTLDKVRAVLPDKEANEIGGIFPKWESIIGKEITQSDIEKGFDRYQYGEVTE